MWRRTRWWWAIGLLLLLLPDVVWAGDRVVIPVKAGVLYGRDLRAGVVESGLGVYQDKLGFTAFGRAGVGPNLALGWGGIRLDLVLNKDDRAQLGLGAGVSAGSGKYEGHKAGLLAAVEPGIFGRLLFERLAVELRADWYQPLYMRPGGVGWGALGTIALTPMFD